MKSYSDEDVLSYVDGEMSDDLASVLRIDMASDPELRQRVDVMLASKLPYSTAYDAHPPPTMPESVRQNVATWSQVARNAQTRTQEPASAKAVAFPMLKVAAISAVAIGISFFAGLNIADRSDSTQHIVSLQPDSETMTDEDMRWALRVAEYQTLYVPETVKQTDDSLVKAVELLSRPAIANTMRAEIPDLTNAGYEFARAQQLGYKGDPLIQLVYTAPGKMPLALCFMPSPGQGRNEISTAVFEGLSSAIWRSSNQRFVIVADETTQAITAIAQEAQKAFL